MKSSERYFPSNSEVQGVRDGKLAAFRLCWYFKRWRCYFTCKVRWCLCFMRNDLYPSHRPAPPLCSIPLPPVNFPSPYLSPSCYLPVKFYFLFDNFLKTGKFTIGQGCPLLGKLPFPIPYKQTKLRPNPLTTPYAKK